jgi:ribose 5-phosphate isomerase A
MAPAGVTDVCKRNAALKALDMVEDGMRLGLGTGSTAAHFVKALGDRVREGLSVSGVATSEATRALAEAASVALIAHEDLDRLDLAVDGADEIDPAFTLIKGGGGALLREKIVAAAATKFVVIADGSKLVTQLGAFPLPIEVTPFAVPMTAKKIAAILRAHGCGDHVTLRCAGPSGKPVLTDGANHILDAACERIPDPQALADALKRIPGVVDHGLFLGMTSKVIVGRDDGADILPR